MTRNPKLVWFSSTAMQASQIMKNENVGILPVMDDKIHKLIGIVTDRDLCLAFVAEGNKPVEVKVSELMNSKEIFCHPDDNIRNAESLIKAYQVRRIAVVDQKGFCVGIISAADWALKIAEVNEFY
ncbi:MAG: CBS domain-containing protein [Nitrospiria bacterium]